MATVSRKSTKAARPEPVSLPLAEIEDGHLVIRLPLYETPQLSSTGKTLVVASTRGNLKSEAEYNGQPVVIGVNAYIYR